MFTKRDFGDGIYAVTNETWSPAPGSGLAMMQTWIVKGSRAAFAIDSGVPAFSEFRSYLEAEFGDIIMACSHGHVDHTGCVEEFDEVWISERDVALLLGGGVVPDYTKEEADLPYKIRKIPDYEAIDLGDRTLVAIPVPGHTKGSLAFLDTKTGSLFAGDSLSRRILYGISEWVPLEEYISALRKLKDFHISRVYTAHDEFVLPADRPEEIIRLLKEYLPITDTVWQPPIPGMEPFARILLGEEKDPEFFDFVLPMSRRDEAVAGL